MLPAELSIFFLFTYFSSKSSQMGHGMPKQNLFKYMDDRMLTLICARHTIVLHYFFPVVV